MNFGISTACFYPEVVENALQKLIDHNIKYTEIFVNTFSELERPYILKIKRILSQGDIKVTAVHPFTSGMELLLFFSNYNRRFEDGLDFYKKYFNFCNETGADFLVFHGAYKEIGFENDFYFERFSKLNETAKSMGIEVLQENVARCKSNSSEFIREMKAALGDSVHFVLDTKQCIRSGIMPVEMLEAMGTNVSHVHISDSDIENDCLPPGKGNGALGTFIKCLKNMNFKKSVLIEIYRQNYSDYFELFESYNWLYKQN